MVANVPIPDVPSQEFNDSMHEWQYRTLAAFDAGCRRFYQRWHRRARKTTCWINLLIRECLHNPNRVLLYVAPTYKQAKSIVWTDPNMLFKWLPERAAVPWRKNEQELSIRFPNGSILRLVGGDDPDSVRGIDCHGVVFDEWALCKPEIWLEIITPIIAQDPDRWAAFIFTPKGMNHAFEMDMAVRDDLFESGGTWHYECLTVDQTGLIPADELEAARRNMPTSMFDQEFYCSYITDEDMVLISSAMLERLRSVERAEAPKKIISCDPSLGGDACPILAFEGSRVLDGLTRVLHSRLEGEIIGELLAVGHQHGCDDYIVDAQGLGVGIAQRLAEAGKRVQFFVSSEKSSDPARFRHLKDEAWWYVRQEVQACRVVYPEDIRIRREVSSVKFVRFDATGVMHLEPKQKTKETLGHSPDMADAWVMGQWGLRSVELEPQTYDPRRRVRPLEINPMTL